MHRRSVVVQGPLAFRMRRISAADDSAVGVEITTLSLLAARLAGGFIRPAQSEDIESAVKSALDVGGFAELEPLRLLPGTCRAATRTLQKVWNADVQLAEYAGTRVADLILLEKRVQEALPKGVLIPRDLRAVALKRMAHARNILGTVELYRLLYIPNVWRPFIAALCNALPVSWLEPDTTTSAWFSGVRVAEAPRDVPPPKLVSCANARAEVIESLRWARSLLASGKARAEEIAISAAQTDEWDEHLLTFARGSGLPIHMSTGVPALSTYNGQACAALADALVNGISQDRVRRLFQYSIGNCPELKDLRRDWNRDINPAAALFQIEHWRSALANARKTDGPQTQVPTLLSTLELLSKGPSAAEEAGARLLSIDARVIWLRALRSAPPEALGLSLQELRVSDPAEAGASIAWCPAIHLAGEPRPWVWLLGMTHGVWPRHTRDDSLLPNHIVPRRILDPYPTGDEERLAFQVICSRAHGECYISRSRRSAEGGVLLPSPLLAEFGQSIALRRGRTPHHAFSESDRLLARPQDAEALPRVRSAIACWLDWSKPTLTPHDGVVRSGHPVIARALSQTQSATSLRRLLQDPISFVWRYALGWQSTAITPEPLELDERTYGELVHELLRRAVESLEPHPGFTHSTKDSIREALRKAVSRIRDEWPLHRPVPPLLLWNHTLAHAEKLAFRGLTSDESIQPGTRSWTEVPFGIDEPLSGDWPWDPTTKVLVPGTRVSIRGRIDRLDVNIRGDARVTDYKTGREPDQADKLSLAGGSDLQRAIYVIAAKQLLPGAKRVVARLLYLREDYPLHRPLNRADQVVEDLARYINIACAAVVDGNCLPGPVRDTPDEYRFALPAAEITYRKRKMTAINRSHRALAVIWNAA